MIENLIVATEHLAGFVIVLMTLTILWGLTVLIGKFFAPSPGAVTGRHEISEEATRDDKGSTWIKDDEMVAVCAAVATLLEERHRIVSVRSLPSGWGLQGRKEIHASHRIR